MLEFSCCLGPVSETKYGVYCTEHILMTQYSRWLYDSAMTLTLNCSLVPVATNFKLSRPTDPWVICQKLAKKNLTWIFGMYLTKVLQQCEGITLNVFGIWNYVGSFAKIWGLIRVYSPACDCVYSRRWIIVTVCEDLGRWLWASVTFPNL